MFISNAKVIKFSPPRTFILKFVNWFQTIFDDVYEFNFHCLAVKTNASRNIFIRILKPIFGMEFVWRDEETHTNSQINNGAKQTSHLS